WVGGPAGGGEGGCPRGGPGAAFPAPPPPGGGRGGGGAASTAPGGVSHGSPPWWVPPPLARSFPQQPPGALAQHRHRFGGGLLRVDASSIGRAAGPCPGMGSDSFLLLGGLDS